MTPCEWSLCLQGRAARAEREDRRIARWLSPLLSATAGQVITPAQLLGEEDATLAPDSPKALRKAERELNAKLRKIARRNKRERAKGEACQA